MGKHKKKKKKPERRPNPKPAKMPERIEIGKRELDAIIEKASSSPLEERELDLLRKALDTLMFLTKELEKKRVSVDRLKRLLFGAETEKTVKVLRKILDEAEKGKAIGKGNETEKNAAPPEEKPKGHGRNGADAYTGAEKILVPLDNLKEGDPCPSCEKGKLYKWIPGTILTVKGQAPISATVYELEKLRCALCGEIFTAKEPEGIPENKYDADSASMISLLKYGTGMPFNRLQRLEGSLGIPLPAATQWDIMKKTVGLIAPAFEELIRQAAQGEVLHNDDTTMKVLGLGGSGPGVEPGGGDVAPERKGVFTSGIVSVMEGRKAALFFTGRRHAGENLAELLKKRAAGLGPPIQMCDALSRNMPGELETILGNCLSHGRRKFVDVVRGFPDECLHVLMIMKDVYRNDAIARRDGMSKEERLLFHQTQSGPKMAELEAWMTAQFEENKVEPNSGLGEAIAYMRKHWNELTLFLRAPGAPLDNNICERILKKAILHRKNAYFFKTLNGARVGDLFMSLIHTCELNGANPFEYLTALQRHADAVSAAPADWMPWNYPAALARSSAAQAK
jgi:transposase